MISSESSRRAASMAAGTGFDPVTEPCAAKPGGGEQVDRGVDRVHGLLLCLLRRLVVVVVQGVPEPAEGDLVQRLDQPVVLGVGRDQQVDADLLGAMQLGDALDVVLAQGRLGEQQDRVHEGPSGRTAVGGAVLAGRCGG